MTIIIIQAKLTRDHHELYCNPLDIFFIGSMSELVEEWKNKNLIEVNNGKFLASTTRSVHAFGTQLSYEPNELRAIKDWNKHDKRFKILPFGAIR